MVYLKHRRLGGMIATTGDGTQYNFIPKNDIALAAIQDNHVAELLIKKCGCCDSEYGCFTLATQDEVLLYFSEG